MYRTTATLVLGFLFLLSAGAAAQQSASSGLVGQGTGASQGALPGATARLSSACRAPID